jgi:hypothetical protein
VTLALSSLLHKIGAGFFGFHPRRQFSLAIKRHQRNRLR